MAKPHRGLTAAAGKERRARGELESEVLAALWASDAPLTASAVNATLATPTAYNTVLTILTRLHEKGLLEREQQGRAHAYRPTQGQADLAAQRMHKVLADGADHASVLQRFVNTLSADDTEALRALLREGR